MSIHQNFKRKAVDPQVAQRLQTVTLPAPTRGLILNENESFIQPGAALVLDNWKPTMKGCALRGGHTLWCDLHPSSFTSATWDAATITNVTLSGGSLVATNTGTTSADQGAHVVSTLGKTSGKYYFELNSITTTSGGNRGGGIGTTASTYTNMGNSATTGNMVYFSSGALYANGSNTGLGLGSSIAAGDVAGFAVDLDNRLIWIRKSPSGNWNGNATHNPATATGGIAIPAGTMVPFVIFGGGSGTAGNVVTANFGGSAFVGAVPSGFVAGWGGTTPTPREPVVSMFSYVSGNVQKMFAGDSTKLYDVTSTSPVLVKSGQLSGNYCASQLANQGGDYLMAVNDAGDYPLRYDGTTWTTLNGGQITGPVGSTVVAGHNLTYVWKYRNRWFFIEGGSMNAWYLPLNAIQGALSMIPLSGAATKGGKLLFGATWSIDAGDGIDDKCLFVTDQGEVLVFTGSDPSTATNWRQEGRYATSVPLGMNAHQAVGGDILVATVDGIIPISASITKDTSQLELASITRAIKPMWRTEVNLKRALPWTMCKWDEYGGMFVTWPGGNAGNQYCAVVNIATGAWARFTGWDAMCFCRMRGDMFFGTQAGKIMQADRTGYDDGTPYTATMVGGWEMFSSQSMTMVWRQARVAFSARSGEPFQPQVSATTDYVIVIPPAPSAAPDPGTLDVWDQGLWATTPPDPEPTPQAKWDAAVPTTTPTVRSTGWISIGYTGFSHAPIVQVTVAQQAVPEVELISIAAVYESCGVNV